LNEVEQCLLFIGQRIDIGEQLLGFAARFNVGFSQIGQSAHKKLVRGQQISLFRD